MTSIAPGAPDNREIYLVLDDFGACLGRAWARPIRSGPTGRR
jgi:hypothetical protein